MIKIFTFLIYSLDHLCVNVLNDIINVSVMQKLLIVMFIIRLFFSSVFKHNILGYFHELPSKAYLNFIFIFNLKS